MILPTLLETLEQSKAKDIQVLEVSKKTPLMDTMIICTATSSRHGKSIAEALVKLAKKNNTPPFSVEGLQFGEWVLVNLGTVVVHVMLAEKRELYQLDQLWVTSQEAIKPID